MLSHCPGTEFEPARVQNCSTTCQVKLAYVTLLVAKILKWSSNFKKLFFPSGYVFKLPYLVFAWFVHPPISLFVWEKTEKILEEWSCLKWIKKRVHLWEMGGKLSLQNEVRCKFATVKLTTPVAARSVSIFSLNSNWSKNLFSAFKIETNVQIQCTNLTFHRPTNKTLVYFRFWQIQAGFGALVHQIFRCDGINAQNLICSCKRITIYILLLC